MIDLLKLLIQIVFVFCVAYALVSDFRKLIIPNWVSITLVAAFACFTVLTWPNPALWLHISLAALIFVIGLVLFFMRWVGGGDVKFMSALVLWTGPEHTAPFLLLVALFSAGLAIFLMALKRYRSFYPAFDGGFGVGRRVVEIAEMGICPYAIPIGIAALIMAPSVFS